MDAPVWFPGALALAAFCYALVGHGGASGYLAAGALVGIAPLALRPTALVLNVLVSGFGLLLYSAKGHQRPRLLLPLVACSMPAAFLTAQLQVPRLAGLAVALTLLASAFRMGWGGLLQPSEERRPPAWALLGLAGLGLGALSGLTGVGGGIYLSPLLLLAGWAGTKETAAVSAAFIFLNSSAALFGLAQAGSGIQAPWPWVAAAGCAGLAGAWTGSTRLPPPVLQKVLAGVLAVAGAKLLSPYL